MRRKIFAALLGTAGLVTMAAPTAASAATNNQRFSVIARFNPDSCQVVAVGPISGVGTCTIEDVSNTSSIVHVTLPNGTVDIKTKSVDESGNFNEGACLFKFSFQETWRIVGGTGAYAGATGRGTDTGNGVFTVGRNPQGGCNDDSEGSGVVSATVIGRVRLGGSSAA